MRYLYKLETTSGITMGCAKSIHCEYGAILICEGGEWSFYSKNDVLSFTIDQVLVN